MASPVMQFVRQLRTGSEASTSKKLDRSMASKDYDSALSAFLPLAASGDTPQAWSSGF